MFLPSELLVKKSPFYSGVFSIEMILFFKLIHSGWVFNNALNRAYLRVREQRAVGTGVLGNACVGYVRRNPCSCLFFRFY